MKKILCFGVLILGLLMCISEANAYTLTDGLYNSRGSWDGGVFKVDNSFLTFCLERNEYFSFGVSYNGTIDAYARYGGIGGGNPDPLGDTTAYLYVKYLDGGYHDLQDRATADAWAKAFQKAIWTLEGELNPSTLVAGSTEKTLYDEAVNSGFANNGQVKVLNLYRGTDPLQYPAQSQLIRTAVPEPSTILLLGVGLLGLIGVPRFRKKTI